MVVFLYCRIIIAIINHIFKILYNENNINILSYELTYDTMLPNRYIGYTQLTNIFHYNVTYSMWDMYDI